jgi:DNA-binding NarL/FixJ family response regulator
VGHQTNIDENRRERMRPLSVLLIEDSALIRRSLMEAIDASGELRVDAWADTPEDAILLLASKVFDAVIVDLQLKSG